MSKHDMPKIPLNVLSAPMHAAVMGQVKNDAGASAEQVLEAVQAQLAQLTEKTMPVAENALREAERAGKVSDETKAQADRLLAQQGELGTALRALTDQVEGLAASNTELAQVVAEGGGPGGASAPQSLGAAVVASEALQNYVAGGCQGNFLLEVHAAITTDEGSGGGLIIPEEERTPVRLPRQRLRIANLVSQGATGTDTVPYIKQTLRDLQASPVAEGQPYAESDFGTSKVTERVKKVGHLMTVSEEVMADAVQLQSELDTEMVYGVELEEERQILAGDGVGENLHGLIPQASAFVAAAGLPNASRVDRLRLALLQVTLASYMPMEIVLSAVDWAAIELQKDANGNHIYGNPFAGTPPRLWGRDVVDSLSMSAGEFLVGDLQMAATRYTRSGIEVLASREHAGNFGSDMVTLKARKRLAFAVKREAALVTGNFTGL